MVFGTAATQVLARTTSLIQPAPQMTVRFYVCAVLPIGLCFSMSLILSNMVYLYLSIAFIQMLKAAGPVVTLLACWSMGLRDPEPSVRVLSNLAVIVAGVVISSYGELHFVALGVVIQAAAILAEGYKNALQQYLLKGTGNMPPLTLIYYSAPACALINGLFVVGFEGTRIASVGTVIPSPAILLANGAFTFALNFASMAVVRSRPPPLPLPADCGPDCTDVIARAATLRHSQDDLARARRHAAVPARHDNDAGRRICDCRHGHVLLLVHEAAGAAARTRGPGRARDQARRRRRGPGSARPVQRREGGAVGSCINFTFWSVSA
jgi:hypothetical protein